MILQFENSSKFFGILQFLKFLIKKKKKKEKEEKECHMQDSIRSYNILLGKKVGEICAKWIDRITCS